MTERSDHNAHVVDQFTQQAENYARLIRERAADRPTDRLALIAPTADDIALDVACGPGSLTFQIAPLVRHITGVDLTPAMIEQAETMQAEKGMTNMAWRVSDVCALPFDDASFSLVTCSAAIHHSDKPRAMFGEMIRVCRPGGRVAILDVTPAADKAAAFDAFENMRDPSHVHAHSTDELRALADGLPVKESACHQYVTAHLPLDAVLGLSFPTKHPKDEIRYLFREDAESGRNRLGMNAAMVDGAVHVSYPMSTIVWRKQ